MATQLQGINTRFWPEAQVDLLKRDEEDKDPIAEVVVETSWMEQQIGKSAMRLWLYLLQTRQTDYNLTVECYKRFSRQLDIPVRTIARAVQRLKEVALLRNLDEEIGSRHSLIAYTDEFRITVRTVAGDRVKQYCHLSHYCYKRIKGLPGRGGKRDNAGRKPCENPKRRRKETRDRKVTPESINVVFKPRTFLDDAQRHAADKRQAKWYDHEEWRKLVTGGNQSGTPKSIESKKYSLSSPSENCEPSPVRPAPLAVVKTPSAASKEWEGWEEKEEKESVDESPFPLVVHGNPPSAGQEVSVTSSIDTSGVNTSDPNHPYYVHPNALAFLSSALKTFSAPETPAVLALRAKREARERDAALLAQLPADPRNIVPMVCVPYPKGLRREMSDKDIAARLAEVYISVLWKRYNIRCWLNPAKIEKSKYFKKLVEVGRTMIEYGVNPVTWTLWSFSIAPDYTRTKVPRLMWVFSTKRIQTNNGWFLRDEPVRGKRFPMQPETVTELHFTYKQFKADVFAGLSVQAALDKHFPDGNYDRWVEYAKRVVAKEQRKIDESIEDGVCVW